jgi:hypothetical protein
MLINYLKRDFIQVLECYILVCKLYWLFILRNSFILIITIVPVLWFMLFPFEAVLYYYYIISSMLARGLFAPSVKSKLHVLWLKSWWTDDATFICHTRIRGAYFRNWLHLETNGWDLWFRLLARSCFLGILQLWAALDPPLSAALSYPMWSLVLYDHLPNLEHIWHLSLLFMMPSDVLLVDNWIFYQIIWSVQSVEHP